MALTQQSGAVPRGWGSLPVLVGLILHYLNRFYCLGFWFIFIFFPRLWNTLEIKTQPIFFIDVPEGFTQTLQGSVCFSLSPLSWQWRELQQEDQSLLGVRNLPQVAGLPGLAALLTCIPQLWLNSPSQWLLAVQMWLLLPTPTFKIIKTFLGIEELN